MFKKFAWIALILALPLSGIIRPAVAQSVSQGQESSQAILSTSVLFAIGAREAEQQIRGAFGWPTFQEGFVDGVYFRFDPDGYARFSTSPRLDEDVFEVVCAAGSVACAAKKGPVEIGLTNEGKVQIKFAGITPSDSFFVSDRTTELPLPPTILEPLDARLETLLATGGELIIKREQELLQTISLTGFSAVATYLRWVAQAQSPRVFPRGWPVPAQSDQQLQSGLTTPGNWTSPGNAPQAVNTAWAAQQGQRFQQGFNQQGFRQNNVVGQGQVFSNPQGGNINQLQSTVQSLQSELSQLRNQAAVPQDEFGAFANQAQGRSLPLPSGYASGQPAQSGQNPVLGAPSNSENSAVATNSNGFNLQRTASHGQGAASQDVGALGAQVYALEVELAATRREIIFRLDQLQHQISQTLTTRVSNNSTIKTEFADIAGTSGAVRDNLAVSVGANNPVPRINQLEALLTQRLNQVQPDPMATEASIPRAQTDGVNLDRDLVEQLLRNLEGTTAPVAIEPEKTAASSMEEAAAKAAGNDTEFISLSDYINNVLKSEEQKTPK